MTTRTTSIGTQTLVYDVLNRLVEITGAGDDMDALYDADGVRVRRGLDGDRVFYLTDSYEIHEPAVGANTETIHFTLDGVSVGSVVDGTLFVSAADHLGSGSISRDDNGATDTQRYTPYGAIRGGGANVLPTDLTFTGQTDDPGTGLIDYNARHYDPQLGRFIMADAVLDGLNRYSYVRNNPLTYSDPTGNVCFAFFNDGCDSYLESARDWGPFRSFRENNPKIAQGAADAGGGVIHGLTGGNADLIFDGMGTTDRVNWDSGTFTLGEIGGVGLQLGFMFVGAPAQSAAIASGLYSYNQFTGLTNALDTCQESQGVDCGAAVVAAAVPDFLASGTSSAVRAAGNAANRSRLLRWMGTGDELLSERGEIGDAFGNVFSAAADFLTHRSFEDSPRRMRGSYERRLK